MSGISQMPQTADIYRILFPFYKLFYQRLKWEEYVPFTYYLLDFSLDKIGYNCSHSVLIVD